MTAEAKAATLPMDDDKPGFGQFFCRETGRYFIVSWHRCLSRTRRFLTYVFDGQNAEALAKHKKTKFYKKRLKQLKEKIYEQEEAEFAAGKTKEILPPAHPVDTST